MLADGDHVCLKCASPFDSSCGFWNFALNEDDDTGRIVVNTLPCMCADCDERSGGLSNGGAGVDVVADRRARIVQRHNTQQLDSMLGVDEPLSTQCNFEPNRVPVLLLRRMLLQTPTIEPTMASERAPLVGYDRDSELPQIFCSFARTCVYVRTARGRALVRRRVLQRSAELADKYQLFVPDRVANEPHLCTMMCAALLRVTAAYDLMDAVILDNRCRYDSDPYAQWYVLQLQLFADTHMDMHLNCDVFGQYTDAALEAPLYKQVSLGEDVGSLDIVHEILGQSLLSRCYPHPLRAVCAGETADATGALAAGDIWTKVSPNRADAVSLFMHIFLTKSSNHPCMVRNLSKILCETFYTHKMMLRFVANLLELHKLGNYMAPCFRPRWRARLAVRRSHHMDRLKMAKWCAWCHKTVRVECPMPGCDGKRPAKKNANHNENHLCGLCNHFKKLATQLYVACKEYYIFVVRCQYVVESMQHLYNQWSAYVDVMKVASNDSRRFFDSIYVRDAPMNADSMNSTLLCMSNALLMTIQCNKTVQRLSKDYRLSDLLLRVANHAQGTVLCKQWTGPQRPEDYLMAPVWRDDVPYAEKQLTRMNVGFERLAHLGDRRWCDVYTLEHVGALAQLNSEMGDIVTQTLPLIGISPEFHQIIMDMQCNSQLRSMPDNFMNTVFSGNPKKPETVVKALCNRFPVDFHVLHYFLQCMHSHNSIYSNNLDCSTAVAQARALRARYKLMPWQPIPHDLDSVFVCRAESTLYAQIVTGIKQPFIHKVLEDNEEGDALCFRPDGEKSEKPFALGVSNALYCHSTGLLYCSKDLASTISRKYRKDGYFDDSEFFGDTRQELFTAKSIRIARETARGCQAPLERVPLLGRAVRIGKLVYTLCVVCAAPCHFSNETMSSNGPTCGRHVQFAESNCYSDLQYMANRFLQQVREASDAKSLHLFPIEIPILCAPPHVKHNSAARDKMYCVGTPMFAENAFQTVNNIIEWDGGGRNKAPTKAALREFAADGTVAGTPPRRGRKPAAAKQAAEAAAVVEEAFEEAKMKPRNLFGSAPDEDASAPAEQCCAPEPEITLDDKTDYRMSTEFLDGLQRHGLEDGVCAQQVAIQCVFCYERCQRKERYVRVTIIDQHGALKESLSGRPIGVRGPVDVWLCYHCFAKSYRHFSKVNIMLAHDLHNILFEEVKRSRMRRLMFIANGHK